ncbi:hypothetical protein VP01_1180g3, partial [Puccinia sorghi]
LEVPELQTQNISSQIKIQHCNTTKMSLTPMDLLLSPSTSVRRIHPLDWALHQKLKTKLAGHLFLLDFGGRILVAIKSIFDAFMGHKSGIYESLLQPPSDLELKIVQEEIFYEILDPSEVFSVSAYRYLPPATFKYNLPLIVLRPIPHYLSPLLYLTSVV